MYRGMHVLHPRRSLLQVELSETKRNKIEERKSLFQQLEARRRVRFSIVKTALLHDLPVASQMTDDEKSACWWSKEQLQSFEESAKRVLRSIAQAPNLGRQEDSYLSVLERVLEICRESSKTS